MVDLRTGVKGDLIIKFNIELPTITNETLIKELTLLNKKESIAEKKLIEETDLVKTLLIDVQDTSNSTSESEEHIRENTQEIPGECKTQ